MKTNEDSVRERLLSQLPQPAGLADYRSEVAAVIDKNQRAFRRERIFVYAGWFFCVACAIGFLWFDGNAAATPKGPWLALIMLLIGAIEILKHALNRSRLDLLKEIKQLQVQMLEARAAMDASARRG